MKTFVIAAATGNIGSKLVKELRDRGHRVIEVSRDTNKAAPLKALSAEIAVGQMDDSEFLTRTFSGADGVFALIPPEYTAESFRGRQNVGFCLRTTDRHQCTTPARSFAYEIIRRLTSPSRNLHGPAAANSVVS